MAVMHVFLSCDRIEDELMLSDQVRLTASLTSSLTYIDTRAGEIKSDYNGTLDIGIARTDGAAGDFKNAQSKALSAVMSEFSPENLGIREIEFGTGDFQTFPDATTTLNYIGWYPADGKYSTGGNTTVTFDIPDVADLDVLYSDVTSGTRLTGFKTMTFRHALVKYTILVYAMEEEEYAGSVAEVWGKIKSVTLENMPSQCVLSLPESSKNLPGVSFESASKPLIKSNLDLTIPVGFSNADDIEPFLAPVPKNDVLSIVVDTEKGGVTRQTLSISTDFQPGKHYQIYLRFTTHGVINAEVTTGDWIEFETPVDGAVPAGMFYNLSESQTANSYIVSSAYNYCFDATVRGNGYTGLAAIPGAPADVYVVTNPTTAEIVWTDLIDSVTDDLDKYFILSPNVFDGKVYFQIPPSGNDRSLPKEGNVVIGVRDDKGQMLWTWHIWLTDRPHEQGYKNGFSVQDRDLGATAYKPNDPNGTIAGVYYQWGRPTPLPLDQETVFEAKYDGGKWVKKEVNIQPSDAEGVAVVDRVKNPTTYYNKPVISVEGSLTKSLWGWRSNSDEYAKTIYDPCPPGYRVPSIKLWRELDLQPSSTRVEKETANSQSEPNAASFKVAVTGVDVYYPMTGYYTGYGDANHTGYNVGAYMWAATFDLDKDLPYGLDFYLEKGSDTQLKVLQTVTEASNNAMPVRCISRMSKAHVTDLSDYQTANSYVISKKGFYKFKATIRGNGIGQLVSPGANSTIVLTEQLQSVDIKSQLTRVEPLWWKPSEDAPTVTPDLTLLNDGAPDADGYISFQVKTLKKGNLILAGYDAKDEIIWSWHLWFVDKDPDMMKSNSFVVMDRNLGATYAPSGTTAPTGTSLEETYGLYYQWGRKDPFVPVGTNVYQYKEGKYFSAFSNGSLFENESTVENKTVANSVKNPTVFHQASEWPVGLNDDLVYQYNYYGSLYLYTRSNISSCNESKYQCFSSMLNPDNRQALWGYSAISNTYGVTTTKTMYDPCPPGYVVAYYLVWTNTERNIYSDLYYTKLDGGFQTHGLTAGTNGIFLTKDYDGRFDPAWYPYSGYMSGKDGTLISREEDGIGIFHTSTPAGNASRSIAYNKYYSGQSIEGSSYGLPSSFAYPVRCQKE